MHRPPIRVVVLLLLVALGGGCSAFLFPSRGPARAGAGAGAGAARGQLQGQHSQAAAHCISRRSSSTRRLGPRVYAAGAAAASEGGNEGSDGDSSTGAEEDAVVGPPSKQSIKPKAFVTKRMRRGPLGPTGAPTPTPKAKPPPTAATTAGSSSSPPALTGPAVLKLSKQWACVAGCGACCYLQPEERPYLLDYFEDPEDLAKYNSMVGDDGWCVHYDKAARACTVFSDRPWFCRVEAGTFKEMYDVEPEEMDKFCTSCCREQIGDVYGAGSAEMLAFNTAIKALKAAARAGPAAAAKPKGFGGGGDKAGAGGGGGSGGKVVGIDPFTQEPVGEERIRADWVA